MSILVHTNGYSGYYYIHATVEVSINQNFSKRIVEGMTFTLIIQDDQNTVIKKSFGGFSSIVGSSVSRLFWNV